MIQKEYKKDQKFLLVEKIYKEIKEGNDIFAKPVQKEEEEKEVDLTVPEVVEEEEKAEDHVPKNLVKELRKKAALRVKLWKAKEKRDKRKREEGKELSEKSDEEEKSILHGYDLGPRSEDEEEEQKPKKLKQSAQNKLKQSLQVDRILKSTTEKGFAKLPKQNNKKDKVYIQKLDQWLNIYSKHQFELEVLERMKQNNEREHEKEVKEAIEKYRLQAAAEGKVLDKKIAEIEKKSPHRHRLTNSSSKAKSDSKDVGKIVQKKLDQLRKVEKEVIMN